MPIRNAGRSVRRAQATRGSALVWAIFAVTVIAGVVAVGTSSFVALERLGTADYTLQGQARAVAEAGLVDAHAWFRRQQTQPVVTFAPVRNLVVVPPINETDDTAIGLVREYEIMPSVWGRYEVRKPLAGEAYVDANVNGRYDYGETFTDSNANAKRDPERETRDVSTQRGLAGAGGAWRIVSHGTVYRRTDPTKALGVAPNLRIASATVASEIRRMTIVPPATAAVCSRTASTIVVGTRSTISGWTKGGIIYLNGTGSPSISGASVTGAPATGSVPSYLDTVDQVFGVDMLTLRAIADAAYSSPTNFPAKIGDFTLNVVTGPITFDATRPLKGTGIVVVEGNCTIATGSNSFFNGILYVKGSLTVRGPVYIRGTVIATTGADIAGSGGDYSEIIYDDKIITSILTVLGQYRFHTGDYEPAVALPDGVPDEENLIRLQKAGTALPGGALPASLGDSLPTPAMGP